MKRSTLICLLAAMLATACSPAAQPSPTRVSTVPPPAPTSTLAATSTLTSTPVPSPTLTPTQTTIPTRTPVRVTTPVAQRATATPGPDVPRNQSFVVPAGESTNPRAYDPATTPSGSGKMVFSGLVAFDPQMKLIPDLAESWQTTDGMTYVFKLRRNARFHNGRPVIAQDFIYSWERAANPKTQSDTVLTYLGDIVGVKEMKEGKANYISGLRAIDDYTLEVKVDAPKPYFLLKLNYPTAFVVDRENVESGPEWYRTPNGTGPYRLVRWDRLQQIIYERNDDYYLEPPAIRYIVQKLDLGIYLSAYTAGTIDLTGVSGANLDRVRDPNSPLHAELLSAVAPCTNYITLDVKQPPFDDPKVRQAFALAFDRQRYIDTLLAGNGVVAKGLFPPNLPGYNSALKGQTFDPARAKQLLAESKYGGVSGLPKIVYTASGTGSTVSSAVASRIQIWQQNLGVSITVENIEPSTYLDEIKAGHHAQITTGGWCADYLDPENFADALFHTGVAENVGHYSNPQVDALLEQARVEQDGAKRIKLYQQAEEMIVNDVPAIFTLHDVSNVLVKPNIQGYVLTPVGISLERFLKFK